MNRFGGTEVAIATGLRFRVPEYREAIYLLLATLIDLKRVFPRGRMLEFKNDQRYTLLADRIRRSQIENQEQYL